MSASNAQGSGLSNYNITYVDASTGLTVTPASLTITASNQTKVYGTNLNLGTTGFTETGLVTANGDAITGVTLSSLGAASTANVGTYALSASIAQGSGLSNYNITYVDASTGLTVTPATLTITASNQSKVYGTSLNLGTTGFTESASSPRMAMLSPELRSLASARRLPQMSGPTRSRRPTRRVRACRITTSLTSTPPPA